jgi:hypothetical protein
VSVGNLTLLVQPVAYLHTLCRLSVAVYVPVYKTLDFKRVIIFVFSVIWICDFILIFCLNCLPALDRILSCSY